MVKTHLAKLQQHERYRKAHKLIFIEANMSYIGADQVAGWCREFEPVIIESRDPSPRGRVGVWTGPYEKESYAWKLRDQMEDDTVYFASDLVGEHVKRDKATFIAQLQKFRMERQEPKDLTFGKFKYAYTGKTGNGEKDDLAMAYMIANYWGGRKREDMQFRMWAKHQGYRL